jgi:WD40 repeat protein
MSVSRPEFHLRRVHADGHSGPVEVYPVHELPGDTAMSRRGFIGTGVAAASVLAAASGCGKKPPSPQEVWNNQGRAHGRPVRSLALSGDGQTLISGSEDRKVKVWSLAEEKLKKAWSPHDGTILAVALSADGKRLATGAQDKTIKLWSLPDGKLDQTITAHANAVFCLAMSANGKWLASGSSDNKVKVWSLPDGKELKTLSDHKNWVWSVALAPDGKLLASASQDQTVKVWSLPDGKLIKDLPGAGISAGVAISADGATLTAKSEGAGILGVWSLPALGLQKTLNATPYEVHALGLSGDGKVLAVASRSTSVQVFALPEETATHKLDVGAEVQRLLVTPSGEMLILAHSDGRISLWDLTTGKNKGFLVDPEASWQPESSSKDGTPTRSSPSSSPSSPSSTTGGRICTCNKVCTCVPVRRRR